MLFILVPIQATELSRVPLSTEHVIYPCPYTGYRAFKGTLLNWTRHFIKMSTVILEENQLNVKQGRQHSLNGLIRQIYFEHLIRKLFFPHKSLIDRLVICDSSFCQYTSPHSLRHCQKILYVSVISS